MLVSSNSVFGVLVLSVVVLEAQRRDSGDIRRNVINIDDSDEILVIEADDGSLQARDKRTLGAVLGGVADLFGYDLQRRPSQIPVLQPVAADPSALAPLNPDDLFARQMAPPASPALAPAAPAPAPAAPITPPATLTDGVRRAFQLGVNWANQRQQLGGAPPAPAPPAPAAPAPATAPAPAAPASSPTTGERRAYTIGLNWQNLRQMLGGAPPLAPAAPSAAPPAGAAPPPAPVAPGPQGIRQSYQVGFDFSNQRQQLGGSPPAPPAPAPAPAPPPAAAAPPSAPAPAGNLGLPPQRVPELIVKNPLTPTLVERLYFNGQNQPSRLNFEGSPPVISKYNPVPFDKANLVDGTPIHLDVPPAEKEEADGEEGEEKEAVREEERKEDTREEEEEEDEEDESEESQKVERQEVVKNTGWRKQKTGDPKEEVYILEKDIKYEKQPNKASIELADYSEDINQRRDIKKRTSKTDETKTTHSLSSTKTRNNPPPLHLLQMLRDDLPEQIKLFQHHRSVRSTQATPIRSYIIRHDTQPSENIDAAKVVNKNLINYYNQKFQNDAILAQNAIPNPQLINEPYYKVDNLPETYTISLNQELIQPAKVDLDSHHDSPKSYESVQQQHLNILGELVKIWEKKQRDILNQQNSGQPIDKKDDVKYYHDKALDGIVKNFQNIARDKLLGDKLLVDQHKQILESLRQDTLNARKETSSDTNKETEVEPNGQIYANYLETQNNSAENDENNNTEYTPLKEIAKINDPEVKQHPESEDHPEPEAQPDAEGTPQSKEDPETEAQPESEEQPETEQQYTDKESIETEDEEQPLANDDEAGIVKVGNEDVVGQHDEYLDEKPEIKIEIKKTEDLPIEEADDDEEKKEVENREKIIVAQDLGTEQRKKQSDQNEGEKPKNEAGKKNIKEFDFSSFFNPSDFIKHLEEVVYNDVVNYDDEAGKKAVQKNIGDEKQDNEKKINGQKDDEEVRKEDETKIKISNETEGINDSNEEEDEDSDDPYKEDVQTDDEEETDEEEAAENEEDGAEDEEDGAEDEEDAAEDEEEAADESESDDEKTETNEDGDKKKKISEDEQIIKEYIKEHFEVDEDNGVVEPSGVKDNNKYKNIVQNVLTSEVPSVFSPKEFSLRKIDSFFDDNVKKLEKNKNKVKEDDEKEKSVENDEEVAEDDEDETEEDNEAELDEDKASTAKSSETSNTRIEEATQQIANDLKYPHEEKFKEVYDEFRQKLTNPETQDSKTSEVIQPPALHSGAFKTSGLAVLQNPEKLVSVPIDYEYSGSEKTKIVVENPISRVKRQAEDYEWFYKPEVYDPSFTYVPPYPKIMDLNRSESITYKDEDKLSPRAVVTESESGRKKTFIRVKQKQHELY